MAYFTTLKTVEVYSNQKGKKIEIKKAIKIGTKMIFFYPVNEKGQRLTSTMFSRKSGAVSLGKTYLNT